MKGLFLILIAAFNLNLYSNVVVSDSTKKNAIKIDLQSVYYTIFDTRKQLRIGLEYERKINNKVSYFTHLDFGIYDHYTFNKIYDFFGTNGGPFIDQTMVKTSGFHWLEGIQYVIKKSKKNNFFISSGLLLDLNYFDRKTEFTSYNSNNNFITHTNQFRIGIGPQIAFKKKIYNDLYFEFRQALIFNTLTLINKENSNFIEPHKAFGFNKKQNFWLTSMFNILYEF